LLSSVHHPSLTILPENDAIGRNILWNRQEDGFLHPIAGRCWWVLTSKKLQCRSIIFSTPQNQLVADGVSDVGEWIVFLLFLPACSVIDYLSSDRVKDLTAEELPGVLWVVGERDDIDVTLAVVSYNAVIW